MCTGAGGDAGETEKEEEKKRVIDSEALLRSGRGGKKGDTGQIAAPNFFQLPICHRCAVDRGPRSVERVMEQGPGTMTWRPGSAMGPGQGCPGPRVAAGHRCCTVRTVSMLPAVPAHVLLGFNAASADMLIAQMRLLILLCNDPHHMHLRSQYKKKDT